MKTLILLLTLIATCTLGLPNCYAQPLGPKPGSLTTVDGFQLSIFAPADEFKVGEPIPVMSFLANVTSKAQYVGMSSMPAYKIEVTTFDGEVIPLTRFGKQWERGPGVNFSNGPLEIAPGENYAKTYTIDNLFDMTLPGRYIVKFSRYINGMKKDAKPLVSNRLLITVR